MIEVRTPANQFFDTDGSPLDSGYIYIGTTGANPETTPQAVYWDKAGTIPAAQPIRTVNGFPARDGASSKFYTSTKNYSITVKDKRGSLVIGTLNSDSGVFDELSDVAGAAGIGYDNTTSSLTAADVQAAIDEVQANIEAVDTRVDDVSDSFSGMINLFANSAFRINTRGYVSGTVTTGANQYTIDRIRVVVLGEALTFTAVDYGYKITAPAGGAEQVIEGIYIVGGDYACTWAGTGTVQINGVSVAKGETFTFTAATDATVRMVGEIEKIRITRPDMIGRYEYNYEADARICRRYARLNPAGSGVSVSATSIQGCVVTFDEPMRATPAASVFSGASAILDPGVAFRTLSSIATNGVTSGGGYLDLTSSGMTSSKAHVILPGKVLFTSEL